MAQKYDVLSDIVVTNLSINVEKCYEIWVQDYRMVLKTGNTKRKENISKEEPFSQWHPKYIPTYYERSCQSYWGGRVISGSWHLSFPTPQWRHSVFDAGHVTAEYQHRSGRPADAATTLTTIAARRGRVCSEALRTAAAQTLIGWRIHVCWCICEKHAEGPFSGWQTSAATTLKRLFAAGKTWYLVYSVW